jgi:hypothetical protein
MRIFTCRCIVRVVCLVGALFAATALHAEKMVVVFASADPAYEASRQKDGKLLRQTYVFVEGRFIGGTVKDPQLEKTPFRRIAAKLAADLREQEYYPSKTVQAADLLLVVHWGATSPRRHEQQLMEMNTSRTVTQVAGNTALAADLEAQRTAEASGPGGFDLAVYDASDPNKPFEEAVERDLFALEASSAEVSLADAAATLGISEELRRESLRPNFTEYNRTLRSFLQEERYFIVVTAYDAQKFFRTRKLHRVWVARLSIRSPGVSFHTALERMSRVGGSFFGTNQEKLRMRKAPLRKADVEIGELILISQDDSE